MEVRYADRKLEKLCTDEKEMWRRRADIAQKLKLRVNALRAAKNVEHLKELDPLGKWHSLNENLDGLWAGSVSRNHRIWIHPEGDGPEVEAVTVTVVDIEDYH